MRAVLLVTSTRMAVEEGESALLRAALRDDGIPATIVAWDDPDVDWRAAAAVLLRSTWDYHVRLDEFLTWAESVAAMTRLWNPLPIVKWNAVKTYLLDLAEAGVSIVPTELVRAGRAESLEAILERRAWDRGVIKPAVSAGAHETHVVAADGIGQDHLDRLVAGGDVLVQPYVADVETRGELSLVYVEGELAHAVTRVPPAGEFRTQPEFGASVEQVEAPAAARAVGARALEALGTPPLYARVDLLEEAGAPQLIELELIEPYLFLEAVPESLTVLSRALQARLAS